MIWMFLSGLLSGALFTASYLWSLCAGAGGAPDTDRDTQTAYELGFKRGRADAYAEQGEIHMPHCVSEHQLNWMASRSEN